MILTFALCPSCAKQRKSMKTSHAKAEGRFDKAGFIYQTKDEMWDGQDH